MPRVALRDIHVRFGATRALEGAQLFVEPGEVHALLGENGAGKSTLVRVLYGMVRPMRGRLELDDRRVELRSPRDALARGIGLVPQHSMLVPQLTVAENLALGARGSLWLGRRTLRERAGRLLGEHALEVDPDAAAGTLAVAQQQRLEIVRALARGARVLVLDEPTAVLAPSEVDSLLELIARLARSGTSVVLISHKLDEIMRAAHRVTVLRAGANAGTLDIEDVEPDVLAHWMVGDAAPPKSQVRVAPPEHEGAVLLRIRDLRAPGLESVSLDVRAGEILALAGIDGNGQTPLEEVLAGVRRMTSGTVECRVALRVLSGDRQRTGLVLDLRVDENLVLPDAAAGGRPPVFERGRLSRRALRGLAKELLAPYDVRGAPHAPARALSGGNQQKVCVARALRDAPPVLVAVNPTRGLDMAAAAIVREKLVRRAATGGAVLLISTDLDEVLALGTRIAVMFRGRILASDASPPTRTDLGRMMLGQSAV
jgi:simple sugar transport system ATP-binding protein